MDIPRIFNITESAHRIHNPFTPDKYATLGAALRLSAGARVLDLGSGSGEMLCTWARDHGIVGTGIDMSPLFTAQAQSRAVELGVAAQVSFIHGDAAGYAVAKMLHDFNHEVDIYTAGLALDCDCVQDLREFPRRKFNIYDRSDDLYYFTFSQW